MSISNQSERSPWPHRLAVVLACATFPLVWVGGLVTTTDAGMAVYDWPTTFGYNPFLYPWRWWLSGPWDLFIEHGHRLLVAPVSILTILLVVILWRSNQRPWLRWFGFGAVLLLVFQATLGGMRVLLDERTLAMLHGCTGPLFFAVTVAMVVFTSRTWHSACADMGATGSASASLAGNVRRLAIATAVLAYLQIVLGAVLRHVPVDAQPATFIHAVKLHLSLAAILMVHILLLVGLILFRLRGVRPLPGLATMLAALICIQVVLGAGTWLVKFAVPAWAASWISQQQVAVQQGGWVQTHVITAHVAAGSAILGTTVALALYAQRLLPSPARTHSIARHKLGAVV